MNDIGIIMGIISFFVLIGFFLPIVNSEFTATGTIGEDDINTSSVEIVTVDDVGPVDILLSVLSMFFWTFGGIPAWLDATVFMLLRITLALTIARNVWVGGGG